MQLYLRENKYNGIIIFMHTYSSLFVDAFALFIFIMEFEELLFWNDPIIEGSAFSKLLTIDIHSLSLRGDAWCVFIWIQTLANILPMWLSRYIQYKAYHPGWHHCGCYHVALSLSEVSVTYSGGSFSILVCAHCRSQEYAMGEMPSPIFMK